MANQPDASLEREIYELLMRFPDRIDQMETRSQEACRRLAREIAALVEARG